MMKDPPKTLLDAGRQAATIVTVSPVTAAAEEAYMDTAVHLLINLHDAKVDAILIACSLATKGVDGIMRPAASALDYATITSVFADDVASARVPKAPEEPKKRPRKMKGSAWFGRPRTPPSEDEV